MTDFESADLKRMVLSIEHESLAEVEKIKEDATKSYFIEKDKHLNYFIKKIELEFKEKAKDLYRTRIMEELKIKSEIRRKFDEAKQNKIEKLLEDIKIILKTKKMSKELINITFKKLKLKLEEEKKFVAFCNEKDAKIVKNYFNGTIQTMPEIGLGGIIVSSHDGKIICDSSYKTRLDNLVDFQMPCLSKKIFKDVSN